jgi:hypothetical protein
MRALILLFACFPAFAETFGVHLVSTHGDGGYNNVNPGLYFRLDNGFTAGRYVNSYKRHSTYVGYTAEHRAGNLSVAVTIGAVTGYQKPVMPLLVPSGAYHFGPNAIRLAYAPKPPQGGGSWCLHLMAERHF